MIRAGPFFFLNRLCRVLLWTVTLILIVWGVFGR